jgi:hypothetical protein
VNQQGQFLFIEKMLPELSSLQAISGMLATGEAKYSLEPGARAPTIEQYLDSPITSKRWRRRIPSRSGPTRWKGLPRAECPIQLRPLAYGAQFT